VKVDPFRQGVGPIRLHLEGIEQIIGRQVIGHILDVFFGGLAGIVWVGADIPAGDWLLAGEQFGQESQDVFDLDGHRGTSTL
jgi:hypothetical protein